MGGKKPRSVFMNVVLLTALYAAGYEHRDYRFLAS